MNKCHCSFFYYIQNEESFFFLISHLYLFHIFPSIESIKECGADKNIECASICSHGKVFVTIEFLIRGSIIEVGVGTSMRAKAKEAKREESSKYKAKEIRVNGANDAKFNANSLGKNSTADAVASEPKRASPRSKHPSMYQMKRKTGTIHGSHQGGRNSPSQRPRGQSASLRGFVSPYFRTVTFF